MKDDLYRQNQRVLDSIESRLHEPDPEPKVRCFLCEKLIQSDGYYYEFGGSAYCQDCLDKYFRHYVNY